MSDTPTVRRSRRLVDKEVQRERQEACRRGGREEWSGSSESSEGESSSSPLHTPVRVRHTPRANNFTKVCVRAFPVSCCRRLLPCSCLCRYHSYNREKEDCGIDWYEGDFIDDDGQEVRRKRKKRRRREADSRGQRAKRKLLASDGEESGDLSEHPARSQHLRVATSESEGEPSSSPNTRRKAQGRRSKSCRRLPGSHTSSEDEDSGSGDSDEAKSSPGPGRGRRRCKRLESDNNGTDSRWVGLE